MGQASPGAGGLGGVSRRRLEFLLRPPGGPQGQAGGPAGAASRACLGSSPEGVSSELAAAIKSL